MNDFEGLLASDFGFKPQGKQAPMAPSAASKPKPSPTLNPTSDLNFDLGSRNPSRPTWSSSPFTGSFSDDRDSVFRSSGDRKPQDFDDLFGGSARFASQSRSSRFDSSSADFDSMFSGKSSGPAVHDKPVYDDDIFDGLPGLNGSSSGKFESAFSSFSSMPKGSGGFDELLAGFGKSETESKSSKSGGSGNVDKGSDGFEDLIPGFGRSSSPTNRPASDDKWHSEPTFSTTKTASNMTDNPFAGLESSSPTAGSNSGIFTDPLEEIIKPNHSGNVKSDNSANDGIYDDMDPFDGLGNFAPTYKSDKRETENDSSPKEEPLEQTSVRSPERPSFDSDPETHETIFDMPKVAVSTQKPVGRSPSPPLHAEASLNEADVHVDMSSGSEERFDSSDDVWLTVSEIPLSTLPTSAPPPSRPPPPRPARVTKDRTQPFPSTDARKKDNEFSYMNARNSVSSPFDELEEFTRGRSKKDFNDHANSISSDDFEMSSTAAASAAAMKDAMDRAEAKFRHAKEVRERETTKSSRSREQIDKDEKAMQDAQDRARREEQERLNRERIQREIEEEEDRLRRRLEKERERAKEIEREREEKEREQRRIEKERERAREIEREREQARQAVQRATREARERAAAEARVKAERAAVGKINAEARERAEKFAVQRAQAEARERAAAEARERAEKAAAEARGRANSEAQERSSAVKAEAEARVRSERAAVQRAAFEARERAAAAARLNQQKNENDLDSFFNMGRASSAPRPRATSTEPTFDTQFQNKQGPGVAKTSSGTSSNMRKTSSATNITDDLAAIFGGGAPSSGDFQDVEGETEERRRARLERHQRTQERAAKALAEKNQRDLQAQMDQAERHRIGETMDIEIKRWAAGKEGNLRALLSTLQYVLWPECGWQPVSLTDLITAAMVKKVYRKSTLCIHPDKVQQKGATLQQKYVAEKVFDILKEAWNKFNSEELF